MVVDAVVKDQFYLIPTAEYDGLIRERTEWILERRNPELTDYIQLIKRD